MIVKNKKPPPGKPGGGLSLGESCGVGALQDGTPRVREKTGARRAHAHGHSRAHGRATEAGVAKRSSITASIYGAVGWVSRAADEDRSGLPSESSPSVPLPGGEGGPADEATTLSEGPPLSTEWRGVGGEDSKGRLPQEGGNFVALRLRRRGRPAAVDLGGQRDVPLGGVELGAQPLELPQVLLLGVDDPQ